MTDASQPPIPPSRPDVWTNAEPGSSLGVVVTSSALASVSMLVPLLLAFDMGVGWRLVLVFLLAVGLGAFTCVALRRSELPGAYHAGLFGVGFAGAFQAVVAFWVWLARPDPTYLQQQLVVIALLIVLLGVLMSIASFCRPGVRAGNQMGHWLATVVATLGILGVPVGVVGVEEVHDLRDAGNTIELLQASGIEPILPELPDYEPSSMSVIAAEGRVQEVSVLYTDGEDYLALTTAIQASDPCAREGACDYRGDYQVKQGPPLEVVEVEGVQASSSGSSEFTVTTLEVAVEHTPITFGRALDDADPVSWTDLAYLL